MARVRIEVDKGHGPIVVEVDNDAMPTSAAVDYAKKLLAWVAQGEYQNTDTDSNN